MSTHVMLHDMLNDGNMIATTAADCSDRAICHIGTDERCFGMTRASLNRVGRRRRRRRRIIPVMLDTSCKQLVKKLGTCFKKILVLIFDRIVILVMRSSIYIALNHVTPVTRERKVQIEPKIASILPGV